MEKLPSPKEAAGWLSVVLKALSLLEQLLPAFLVSWADYLKRRNAELRSKVAYQAAELEAQKHASEVKDKVAAQDPGATIDDFLRSKFPGSK